MLDTSRQVMISQEKVSPENLAALYNMVDCTINISDAEGFGLATLESLSCGTPIIVNMTGGLQEQVTNGVDWFGFGLRPSSKAIIGSQSVPYIAMDKMFALGKKGRRELGLKGKAHVTKNYNFVEFQKQWVELIDSVVESHGSWETRVGYNGIRFKEVA